jgi:hypothetical protein
MDSAIAEGGSSALIMGSSRRESVALERTRRRPKVFGGQPHRAWQRVPPMHERVGGGLGRLRLHKGFLRETAPGNQAKGGNLTAPFGSLPFKWPADAGFRVSPRFAAVAAR